MSDSVTMDMLTKVLADMRNDFNNKLYLSQASYFTLGLHSVAAHDSLQIGVQWTKDFHEWDKTDRGPVAFQALPRPQTNGAIGAFGAVEYPLYTECGMTAYVGVRGGYAYWCRVKNENPIAVSFVLRVAVFPMRAGYPDNWMKASLPESPLMKEIRKIQRITVLTDNNTGKIVGTSLNTTDTGSAEGEAQLAAGPGQSVRVVDLPEELQLIEDANELHTRLESLITQGVG